MAKKNTQVLADKIYLATTKNTIFVDAKTEENAVKRLCTSTRIQNQSF
jgi:hypothetical protein